MYEVSVLLTDVLADSAYSNEDIARAWNEMSDQGRRVIFDELIRGSKVSLDVSFRFEPRPQGQDKIVLGTLRIAEEDVRRAIEVARRRDGIGLA